MSDSSPPPPPVLSERDAESDPVTLWLNGGPGCSSFDGWVYEMGPFKLTWGDEAPAATPPGAEEEPAPAKPPKVQRGEGKAVTPPGAEEGPPKPPPKPSRKVRLVRNPYAWSRVSTMLFLDSPAGVGFSYPDNREDLVVNDTRTAADTDAFLRKFFTIFTALRARRFFIAGESYGGIYVPMAAREVVRGNAARRRPHINLEGYAVGNGEGGKAGGGRLGGSPQRPLGVRAVPIPRATYPTLLPGHH